MNNIPTGLKRPLQKAIEIRVWEVYLIRSRNHLGQLLSTYALDKRSAIPDKGESTKITFHFVLSDWEKTIVHMLASNHVPYEVVRIFDTDIYKPAERKKVYVAEDDLNILFALNTMLEDAGYDVLLSHCGAPMMESTLPSTDIFILDNRMPDVDGVDVCRHLKAQPATKDIPIIMISALRNFSAHARNAGVDEFLEKPFLMNELLRLIKKHTTKIAPTNF